MQEMQDRKHGFEPLVRKILWRRELNPLQYSWLENSMDCIVHGVAKSRTPLSDFHFHFIKKHLGAGKRLVKRKPTGFLLRVG